MASIKFACKYCNGHIEADEDMGGYSAECPHCHQSVLIPTPGIHPGKRIAGYTVERKLGTGGMGEVWLANHEAMDRKVALKILPPGLTQDETFVKRFMQEVKTSAKLTHPNMVAAFDAGVDRDIYYLAISFIEGEELSRRLHRERKIEEKEALRIVRAIGGALLYAWRKFGLLHRDIKPANIMIDKEGEALLMDMGIAKTLTSEEPDQTMQGAFLGTPLYMSPEQARGDEDIDFRSDIYSLGATLYHLLAGEPPFRADTLMGILNKHINEPLPPAQDKNPSISNPCAALLDIMMAKDRNDRQQSWADVIRDVQRVMQGRFPKTPCPAGSPMAHLQTLSNQVQREPGGTPSPTAAPPAASVSSGLKPIIVGLAVVAVMLLSWGLWKQRSRKAEPAETPPVARTEDSQPASPQASKSVGREQAAREAWDYAVQYADTAIEDRKNFKRAIEYFTKIKASYEGTRYDMMADEQIDRIKQAAHRAHRDVMASLEQQTTPLLAEHRYDDAIRVFKQYRGPLQIETAKTRNQRANAIEKEKKNHLKSKAEMKQRQEKERRALLTTLGHILLRGRYAEALDTFERSPAHKQMEEASLVLRELNSIRDVIRESIEADVGRDITVQTTRGPQTVRLLRVSDYGLHAEQRVSGGMLEKNIPFQALSVDEKRQRMAALDPRARAILDGVEALQEGRRDVAESHLSNAGMLGVAMLEELTIMASRNQEDSARQELERLLADAGIQPGDMKARDLTHRINRKTIDPRAARELMDRLYAYRRAHGRTALAAQYESVLTALERAIDFSLRAAD